MNREIKFRAWDKSWNVMYSNFQFIKSGDEGNVFGLGVCATLQEL